MHERGRTGKGKVFYKIKTLFDTYVHLIYTDKVYIKVYVVYRSSHSFTSVYIQHSIGEPQLMRIHTYMGGTGNLTLTYTETVLYLPKVPSVRNHASPDIVQEHRKNCVR
jgi:hypothetical protein